MIKKVEPIEIISILCQIKDNNSHFTLPYSEFLKMVENIENAYISLRINAGYSEFMKITQMYENLFQQVDDSISAMREISKIQETLAFHSPSQEVYSKIANILGTHEKDS